MLSSTVRATSLFRLLPVSPLRGKGILQPISLSFRKHSQVIQEEQNRKAKVERPIAPHLSIWNHAKVDHGAILHRATGILLSAGVFGVGCAGLVLPCDLTFYVSLGKALFPSLVTFSKAAIAFPMVYHATSGARYLFWEQTQKGLQFHTVDKGTRLMVVLAVLLTAGISVATIKRTAPQHKTHSHSHALEAGERGEN